MVMIFKLVESLYLAYRAYGPAVHCVLGLETPSSLATPNASAPYGLRNDIGGLQD